MSTTALDRLTQSVQNAAAEVKKLRRANERLAEKAAKLEQKLADTPSEAPSGAGWAEEREVIQQRLERLAEHLEGVLEEE